MSDPTTATRIDFIAPLTGVLVPIEEVPDPVFAQKMMGEGFSIDPLAGQLVAPVAGEVVDVQQSGHAVTVRSEDGLDVLMHIGLDTVALQGQGFTPLVEQGQRVTVGQPLIDFELDFLATRAKSLLTQIVIANSDRVDSLSPKSGLVKAGQDVAAEVVLAGESTNDGAAGSTAAGVAAGAGAGVAAGAAAGAASAGGSDTTIAEVIIPNPTGMHARPAANLVNVAKDFESDIQLDKDDESGSAKSIVSILAMALAFGDKMTITATGPDAQQAVTALTEAINGGLGEDVGTLPSGTADTLATPAVEEPSQAEPVHVTDEPRSGDPNVLLGVTASPGLGIGRVVQMRQTEIQVQETGEDPGQERAKLDAAIQTSINELGELQQRLVNEGSEDKAEIFGAHQEILRDPELVNQAQTGIDQGKSAAFAWRESYTGFATQLEGLQNEVLAGRAADMRDVGQRVLETLTGQHREQAELAEGTILVAEDLTPSDTAQLDRSKVVGFATTQGGASSHVAIIARSMDIPAVAGIEARALDIPEGSRVVLDGTAGKLQLNLSDEQISGIEARQQRMAERKAVEDAAKDEPAVTTDGHRVAVVANIGGADDAREAMQHGAEGVGLLRSEFVFMERPTAPTEQEQADVYAECSRALKPGQPLVLRTLDVGGDKPLSYLPIPKEENPFLGLRGVRVGLEQPEVLRTQLRAIFAAAGAGAELHVMFPMIATIADWRAAKAIFDEEKAASGITTKVSCGIMMEVPSVAVMAQQFAAEEGCDFFSVGTNDLTSYTLAMDRGHPKLAAQVDPCNPAVLTLIGQAAAALHAQGKWLGVCGGVASDPQAVPILVGLGVDELSASIPAIPSVKAKVREYSLEQCKELAAQAVTCSTPEEVRSLVPMDQD
ncbi:phosphoenolpyruvate--protein phosphotransferase [Kocuria sp. JC486]|uniref:phosphoenolpyruvate--protein phosphotransferase n=1 Tax=Kocuria sp. JC486 TaxID=1970736 RepID=UPI00141E08D7|nr:phosphoenolpyruvate--protein phosphotransferase [Kocuria sp. JC486]NHU86205.1 phosphoenolpyruvate--protein phosphotransferase [Kocuria sp. JC486]